MILKLTEEMRKALEVQPGEPLPLEDERTHKEYVIVEREFHRRALDAFALQEQEDLEAIRRGLEDMHAGRLRPLSEADADLRKRLGFPPRS